jgi:hypothetical protein
MIRKPIGNWQFALGKICVVLTIAGIAYYLLPIAYCPLPNKKTLPGMRGFITMNKAELIS